MDRLRGSYTIAFTPFTKSGEVDYDEYSREVAYLAGKTGASGVVMYGMTSEYHKLTDAEKDRLTDAFLEVMQGTGVVSVLSVTDWATEVAVKTARRYQDKGVDMLMCMPPFYFGPRARMVQNHMIGVLDAVDIPVILQYAPLATKLELPDEALLDMSRKYPRAAFKLEYRPALAFTQRFLSQKSDMPIMAGWAGLEAVELFKIGVRGVLTVGGFTELYATIYRLLEQGNEAGARTLYNKLEKYISGWMINPESLLAIEKTILHRRGILKNDVCRHPCYELTDGNSKEIDAFLVEFQEYFQ